MGSIKVGRDLFENASYFRISKGVLFVNSVEMYTLKENEFFQIKVTDGMIDNIKTSSFALIIGSVRRAVGNGWASISGSVAKYFVKSNRKYYNKTAKQTLGKEKRAMKTGVPDMKRVIVKCSGVFSNVLIKDEDVEVWIEGEVNNINFEKNMSVQGSVLNLVVDNAMYLSKY